MYNCLLHSSTERMIEAFVRGQLSGVPKYCRKIHRPPWRLTVQRLIKEYISMMFQFCECFHERNDLYCLTYRMNWIG